jgi:hypothetical protein
LDRTYAVGVLPSLRQAQDGRQSGTLSFYRFSFLRSQSAKTKKRVPSGRINMYHAAADYKPLWSPTA